MLSRADADLVKRDRALPGLSVLLDPEALAEALQQAAPGVSVGTVQIVYIRYKPGVNCLVNLRADVNGTTLEMYAKAHGPDAAEKLKKPSRQASIGGFFGTDTLVCAKSRVIFHVFPNDAKLLSLARLFESEARERVLKLVAPERAPHWRNGRLSRLAYKPERRFVGQLSDRDGPSAVLRVYTDSGYRSARAIPLAFASRDALTVARRIGCAKRIVALEWLPGRNLREALAALEPHMPSMIIVGQAIAALHAQEPGPLRPLERHAEAEALIAAAESIGFVCPRLRKSAKHLALWLGTALHNEEAAYSAIHGDFYSKQVLLSHGKAALLDLDEAVRGDPAADLGNFIAHLERDSQRRYLTPHLLPSVCAGLLEGYRQSCRGELPPRIPLYVASCLLRLVPHAFRDHLRDWPDQTEALLDRVEQLRSEAGKRYPVAA